MQNQQIASSAIFWPVLINYILLGLTDLCRDRHMSKCTVYAKMAYRKDWDACLEAYLAICTLDPALTQKIYNCDSIEQSLDL